MESKQHSFTLVKEKLKIQEVHNEFEVQAEQFKGQTKQDPNDKYFPTTHV